MHKSYWTAYLIEHDIIDIRTLNIDVHRVSGIAFWIDGSSALYYDGLHCKSANITVMFQ